jgi:hypothetical protein
LTEERQSTGSHAEKLKNIKEQSNKQTKPRHLVGFGVGVILHYKGHGLGLLSFCSFAASLVVII